MKSIIMIISIVLMSLGLTACAQRNKEVKTVKENMSTHNVMVAYFSATGTTEGITRKIAEYTDGDLVRIEPEKSYTGSDLDWNDPRSRSSVEMGDSTSRPSIKPSEISVDKYDVVFIGYPIWWDLAPRVVNTFIESYNLSGKRIVPFATSGGSGISNSVNNLKKTYPSLDWENGRLINRSDTTRIQSWIDDILNQKN